MVRKNKIIIILISIVIIVGAFLIFLFTFFGVIQAKILKIEDDISK